jgi:hypothetical protein
MRSDLAAMKADLATIKADLAQTKWLAAITLLGVFALDINAFAH